MYLSYSGYKLYKSCPRAYYHRYLAKTENPERENKVNSLFGTVVGLLFEIFYAEKLWLTHGIVAQMQARAPGVLDQAIAREERSGSVTFTDPRSNYKSRETLLADILEAIPRGVGIIRRYRLLGKDAQAEVKLDIAYREHMIGGRADFILTRIAPDSDNLLLEGKGSKWREKYVDPVQLLWYAMLYEKHHGRLPDRLGFVFWRSEPEAAMDWIDVDPEKIRELWDEVLQTMDAITVHWNSMERLTSRGQLPLLMEHFAAKPDRWGCKLCSYAAVCPEGRGLLGPSPDMDDASMMLALGNEEP
jgi:hypothetical protein